MEEITEKRGETYKVFQKESGRKRYEIRCKPIHYLKGNKWEEIDPSFSLIYNEEKERNNFLSTKNKYTVGFRGDKNKEKLSGIRYKGNSNSQYEFTPIQIVFDSETIILPETFFKVELITPFTIEHSIDSEISILSTNHEAYLQTVVKTKKKIGSFNILEKIDLTGITIENSFTETKNGKAYTPTSENEFVFVINKDEKIRIPQPKMWNEEKDESLGVNHSLFEENGILYYEKTSTEEGNEWLEAQTTTLYLDETSYYAETSDGFSYTTDGVWSTCRTEAQVWGKSNAASNCNYTALAKKPFDYYVARGWFWFDTSAIDDAAIISSAVLNIYGYDNSASSVCAMLSTQNDIFTNWTNNAFSGSEYGHVTWEEYQYNQITFNSTGKGNVNKTGDTKVCLREYTYDYSDSAPGDSEIFENGCYFSEETGTDKDPFLTIELAQALEDTVEGGVDGTPSYDFDLKVPVSDIADLTPTLAGFGYGVIKTITESTTPTVSSPFTLISTQPITETSILTISSAFGVTKSFSLSSTLSTVFALELMKALSASGTPTLAKVLDFAPIISDTSSITPTIEKVLDFTKTLSVTEASVLSAVGKLFLELSLSGTFTPTSFDAYVDSVSFSSTSISTLADILTLYLIPTVIMTGIPTAPSKLTLGELTFTMSQAFVAQDAFSLVVSVSDTVTTTLLQIFKFIVPVPTLTPSGTPSVTSSEGTFEVIPFSGGITPTLTDTVSFVPTITVTATGDLLAATKLFLSLVSESMTESFSVKHIDVANIYGTITGTPTKTTAWTTSQSFSGSSSITIEDFLQYTKTLESIVSINPTTTEALSLLATLSTSFEVDTAVEIVQTLLASPTITATGVPTFGVKFILEQLITGTGVLSEVSKFFISKIFTSDMTNTISASFSFQDSVSISLEGIPLVQVVEIILGTLSLVLEDNPLLTMILEDE